MTTRFDDRDGQDGYNGYDRREGRADQNGGEESTARVFDLGRLRGRRKPPADPVADFQAEIDDERDELDTDAPVAVDPPDSVVVPVPREAERRRAILPAWSRSREEFRNAARWVVRHYTHTAGFHLVRIPRYAGILTARAPIGLARLIGSVARWTLDTEGAPVRAAAVRREDAELYLKLSRQRDGRVRLRTMITVAGLVLGTSAVVTLLVLTPRPVWWLALALLIGSLGLVGTPRDKPLIGTASVKPRARKLTADIVIRAFVAAGLCKADDPISFPAPIMRDGPGWRAVIDLPYGVTADKAIKRRTELAAGLDLDEVQVWPERVRGSSGSARRLSLWVADEDPYAAGSGRWPLVASGTADIFQPVPFGTDQRGVPVPVSMMFTSLLVGAIPRMGKTFAARLPVLAAALDVIVELHVYDGKGGQDWRPFERIAHRVGFGVRDETVLALVEDLRALVVEMNRRYDTIATLPPELCPESKVTRAIAERRSLRLWPILVSIDEFQRYSGHPAHGEEIVSLLTELCKVGPSVGIVILLATQKPDSKAVPTDLRDNIGTRFALKTMTWQSSEAVLGAGSYPAGYDSSRLQRGHKGVGILLGADDSGSVEEAVTVRTFIADINHVTTVVDRARGLRQAAGTLSGAALGEAPERADQGESLLEDILIVVPASEAKVWSETVVTRLAELRPESYGGWAAEQLSSALKPHGITVSQVWGRTEDGKPANRKGVLRYHIADALTERNRRRKAG